MSISAVGFLFENKGFKKKNYTCSIHTVLPDGGYSRNMIYSPDSNKSNLSFISNVEGRLDIINSINKIKDNPVGDKFIGATVKDGIKETEIHSLLSDKLYAVRTKDIDGKNKLRVLGKDKTQEVLAKNLSTII
jgi:hypothetical protein